MYVLDTNICIFVLKNRSNQLRHKFKATKDLAILSVTYGELCYGIENGEGHLKKQRWEQLETFTQRLFIEPWDKDAARQYGFIRAVLKKHGNLIGNNDLLIAAHAISLNAILVTNNVKEFERIPDLTIEDWTAETTPSPKA